VPVSFVEDTRQSKAQTTINSKKSVMERIGGLNLENVLAAGALLNDMPKAVSASANSPLTAQAVFFALLLDSEETIRREQLRQIQENCLAFLVNETLRLYPLIRTMPEEEKIPLAQKVSASLREMTAAQYKRFSTVVDLLIAADQKMSLFEYTIKAVLFRDLDIYFGLAKQLCVRHTALSSVSQSVVVVLSYLAYHGHESQGEAQSAFSAAMQELKLPGAMLAANEATIQKFDQALRTLAETSPTLKKQIFASFMTCVWHDGKITPKEAGLIRAIAAMLAIPMPVLA
jgi:hypothetical protein